MQQSLTGTSIPKALYSTITSKGQVTIPVEVRKHLGVDTNDKIAFVISSEGAVQVKSPKYPTMVSLAGAAGKLKNPLSWKKIEEIVRDEQAETYAKKNP